MVIAVYPGSFDPFHLGHLSVVEQVAVRYEEVVVAVLGNSDKTGSLGLAQRAALVAASTRHLPNVATVHHRGLLLDLAADVGADVVVRGAGKEVANEIVMAVTNRLVGGIQTVFVAPSPATSSIGSRQIREVVAAGRVDLARPLVPAPVFGALEAAHT